MNRKLPIVTVLLVALGFVIGVLSPRFGAGLAQTKPDAKPPDAVALAAELALLKSHEVDQAHVG